MALFTCWSGDDYAAPERVNNLTIQKDFDVATLAYVMNQEEQNIEMRLQEGHEAWVVRVEGRPVSFGWVSRGRARIGELSKEIELPKRNAYLWNFRTLEPYRGRGYYAQLLITILTEERKTSDRMWIISAPENQSSFNGIMKAGFKPVGDIMFNYKNEVVLLAASVNERSQAGADLINVPITTTDVRPCWKCASKTMKKEASCNCHENHLPCCCNNQNKTKNTIAAVTNTIDGRIKDIL
jgi:GNAT superfamily N-acetyltransferase